MLHQFVSGMIRQVFQTSESRNEEQSPSQRFLITKNLATIRALPSTLVMCLHVFLQEVFDDSFFTDRTNWFFFMGPHVSRN